MEASFPHGARFTRLRPITLSTAVAAVILRLDLTMQDPVLAHVISLELRLLEPATRAAPTQVRRLLHAEFREVGASGRVWDRDSVAEALAAEPGESSTASDITARFVSDDVVLVTYTASQRSGSGRRDSLRGALWLNGEDGWRSLFHQGTPTDLTEQHG